MSLSAASESEPCHSRLAGNYTLVQEGERGGATRLNKEAVSRKPGVIEDIEQFSCQRPIHQNMEKQGVHKSFKCQGLGPQAGTWVASVSSMVSSAF